MSTLDLIGLAQGIEGEGVADPIEAAGSMRCEFSDDPRMLNGDPGTDRLGFPYATKVQCGNDYEAGCPLYLEESCPGCKTKGSRVAACVMQKCGGACGGCGGGGWSRTHMACGIKSGANGRNIMAEFGGSLRTDQWWAGDTKRVESDVFYFPTTEWGAKDWTGTLNEAWKKQSGQDYYPMLGTTMKSVMPGRNGKNVQLLRQRLGFPHGTLVVNGLTKDDLLDNVWDDRRRIIKYMIASGVDVAVTPEFSMYNDTQIFGWIYNMNRTFAWYCMCVEAGIPHVVLNLPVQLHAKWVRKEIANFIERNNVRTCSLSLQQWRGGYGETVSALKTWRDSTPEDLTWIVYGPGSGERVALVKGMLRGRKVIISTKEAFARAAFFELVPQGAKAPPGMKSDEVFARNVLSTKRVVDRILDR